MTTEAKPPPPTSSALPTEETATTTKAAAHEPAPSKPEPTPKSALSAKPSATVVSKDEPAKVAPVSTPSVSVKDEPRSPATKVPHRSGRKQPYQKKKMTALSSIQKKEVDAVFEKLFGYPWGTTPSLDQSSHDSCQVLLTKVLGSKKAARVLYNLDGYGGVKFVKKSSPPKRNAPQSHVATMKPFKPSIQSSTAVDETAAETADPTPRQGQPQQPTAVASGVDSLLKQMQDKKPTSTIMRTAMDWESFKEQSGTLGEKLEQHAESKGAYLKRQDFLNRVDNRKFEQERDERERTRSKEK